MSRARRFLGSLTAACYLAAIAQPAHGVCDGESTHCSCPTCHIMSWAWTLPGSPTAVRRYLEIRRIACSAQASVMRLEAAAFLGPLKTGAGHVMAAGRQAGSSSAAAPQQLSELLARAHCAAPHPPTLTSGQVGLDAVGQCIHAGRGGQALGHAQHQKRVIHGDGGGHLAARCRQGRRGWQSIRQAGRQAGTKKGLAGEALRQCCTVSVLMAAVGVRPQTKKERKNTLADVV